MEYRFNNTEGEPQEGSRVKFVLKRPDGAKRVSSSVPLPVKYAMEDEIVDEALQRGGLRKIKHSKRPSRFQSLYDFGNDIDPFLLSANHPGLETRLAAHSGPSRSPSKPKLRHLALALTSSSKPVPPPRLKTVSFKDDIVPMSSRVFTAKRKHKDVHEHRSTPSSRSPKQPALDSDASHSTSAQAHLAVALAAGCQPAPAAASSVLDVASISAPCSFSAPRRAIEEEDFFVPATAPDATEPAPPASDEAPSQ